MTQSRRKHHGGIPFRVRPTHKKTIQGPEGEGLVFNALAVVLGQQLWHIYLAQRDLPIKNIMAARRIFTPSFTPSTGSASSSPPSRAAASLSDVAEGEGGCIARQAFWFSRVPHNHTPISASSSTDTYHRPVSQSGEPRMRWSRNLIPSICAADCRAEVSCISALLGVGSPLG